MERAAMGGARGAVRGTPVTQARSRVVASRARQARRVTAQATEVAVLNETGAKSGTATLDLKNAGESSKGLVHRYVVHVLRNQVRFAVGHKQRRKADREWSAMNLCSCPRSNAFVCSFLLLSFSFWFVCSRRGKGRRAP